MTDTLKPDAAPRFEDSPFDWALWYIRTHPELYRKFRTLADEYLSKRPGGSLSADMILHVIRYQGGGVDGDSYRINNNLTPLYARLYQMERPDAPISTRVSWLDKLDAAETRALNEAFDPLRERQEGWARLWGKGAWHYVQGDWTLCHLGRRAGLHLEAEQGEGVVCNTCTGKLRAAQAASRDGGQG